LSASLQTVSDVGTPDAMSSSELLTIVYDELRRLASARLKGHYPNSSVQATALVHEVYLKMVGTNLNYSWQNRSHFFAVASEAMRCIVIDLYRKKYCLKRGGENAIRVELDLNLLAFKRDESDLLSISEALDALEQVDAQKALLVKLRFFVGMNMSEGIPMPG